MPGYEFSLENINALRKRDIDIEYDWQQYINKHLELDPDWLVIMKERYFKDLEVNFASLSVKDNFNLK